MFSLVVFTHDYLHWEWDLFLSEVKEQKNDTLEHFQYNILSYLILVMILKQRKELRLLGDNLST